MLQTMKRLWFLSLCSARWTMQGPSHHKLMFRGQVRLSEKKVSEKKFIWKTISLTVLPKSGYAPLPIWQLLMPQAFLKNFSLFLYLQRDQMVKFTSHEGRHSSELWIPSTNSDKNTVYRKKPCFGSSNKTPNLKFNIFC